MNKNMPDIADYPIPEGRVAENEPEPLYDSTWKRYDKIVAFKRRLGKYVGDDLTLEDEEEQERMEQEHQELAVSAVTIEEVEAHLQDIFTRYPTFKLPDHEKRVVGRLALKAKKHMPLKEFRPWRELYIPTDKISQPTLSRWMADAVSEDE